MAFFSVGILFPFLYSSALRAQYAVINGGFTGFYTSRTAFASFLIIPFAYFLSLALHSALRRAGWLSLAALIPLSSLILWTGSRAAYGAAVICVICVFMRGIWLSSVGRRFAFVCIYGLSACLIFTLAYATLPAQAQNIVLLRFFPQFSYFQNIPSEQA